MLNIFKICIIFCLFFLVPNITMASVSNGYSSNKKQTYSLTYPIINLDNNKIEKQINNDIKQQVENFQKQTQQHIYDKIDMTYYEKYEDENIISLMFYINTKKKFSIHTQLSGYTITYDKHTGERVPMSRYLNITLEQLQDALNNSKAYAVDGLDNGVNLTKKIPYVSTNYFICHDGSIGLLYQPGDLMDKDAGACKIVISPETINKVNSINN